MKKNLTMLPKTNIVLLFNQQYTTSYNTILVLQCNKMQHNTGGTVQYGWQIQFQTLVDLPKWYFKILLVSNPHHSLRKLMAAGSSL